jgi:hypothetical protein
MPQRTALSASRLSAQLASFPFEACRCKRNHCARRLAQRACNGCKRCTNLRTSMEHRTRSSRRFQHEHEVCDATQRAATRARSLRVADRHCAPPRAVATGMTFADVARLERVSSNIDGMRACSER